MDNILQVVAGISRYLRGLNPSAHVHHSQGFQPWFFWRPTAKNLAAWNTQCLTGVSSMAEISLWQFHSNLQVRSTKKAASDYVSSLVYPTTSNNVWEQALGFVTQLASAQ